MKFILLTLAVATVVATASAQNCGITGVNNSTILIASLNETTPGDYLAWESPTYNVTNAGSLPGPLVKYISGLRYASRYVYKTTANFTSFMKTERMLEIRRDVIFTCEDGKQIPYTFIFPVEDENTEPPHFNRPSFNFTTKLSNLPEEPINLNITVSDADVHIKNANVFIRSSNPYITLYITPLFSNVIPPFAYEYKVEFILNKDFLEPGNYHVIITADDGRHSEFTLLDLTLEP